MATSSFFNNVHLHGKKQCQRFIRAMEESAGLSQPKPAYSRPVKNLNAEQIRKVFGKEC